MPEDCRGYSNLYNEIFDAIEEKSSFIQWIEEEVYSQGVVAYAPAWYQKKNRWYLANAYDCRENGNKSTWYALPYPTDGTKEPKADHVVMRHFDLESGENMITTHGKRRPVILINLYSYSWMQPATESYHEKTWLCVPVFKYKSRHTNKYILNDQRLLNPGQFYMPESYDTHAGFDVASCAHLNAMQVIPEKYLTLWKNQTYDRGIVLTSLAVKLLLFHYIKNMNVLSCFLSETTSDEPSWYDIFKDEVNKVIDSMN